MSKINRKKKIRASALIEDVIKNTLKKSAQNGIEVEVLASVLMQLAGGDERVVYDAIATAFAEFNLTPPRV
jgi:hypothetical protein